MNYSLPCMTAETVLYETFICLDFPMGVNIITVRASKVYLLIFNHVTQVSFVRMPVLVHLVTCKFYFTAIWSIAVSPESSVTVCPSI